MKKPQVAPDEVEFSAIRAQGACGQNVNKVSNAVHLRFDIRASSLPDAVKARLQAMVDEAAAPPPPPLRATKPTFDSKQRRLAGKSQRSEVKAGRGRVRDM